MILALSRQKSRFLEVVGGSLLIALFSQIAIPFFFTPVPLTLQTLAIFLIARFLGPKKGVLAIALYLLEGGLGLPFFAGGAAGLLSLVGPTGGYFLGFLLVPYLLQFKRGFWLATGAIWFFGALWLAPFVGGLWNAILFGVIPFVFGDILKIFLAQWISVSTQMRE